MNSEQLRQAQANQKIVLALIGARIGLTILPWIILSTITSATASLLPIIVYTGWAVDIVSIYFAYRLAASTGMGMPGLWALFAPTPFFVGLVLLIVLAVKANTVLKAHGAPGQPALDAVAGQLGQMMAPSPYVQQPQYAQQQYAPQPPQYAQPYQPAVAPQYAGYPPQSQPYPASSQPAQAPQAAPYYSAQPGYAPQPQAVPYPTQPVGPGAPGGRTLGFGTGRR